MNGQPARLRAIRMPVDRIDADLCAEMFRLFAAHYEAVDADRFASDLEQKDEALLLFDAEGEVRGFTLVAVRPMDHPFPCTALYSGDTVVDRRWWARNDLVLSFFRTAGLIKSIIPDRPLYWSVIINGFRTWRVLPAGFRTYWPNPTAPMPADIIRLRDHLGTSWFGGAYDPMTGLVRFEQSIGHLKPDIGAIPERLMHKRPVRFFAEINPGYLLGDELFCLGEFSAENLRGAARRAYLEAWSDTSLQFDIANGP